MWCYVHLVTPTQAHSLWNFGSPGDVVISGLALIYSITLHVLSYACLFQYFLLFFVIMDHNPYKERPL